MEDQMPEATKRETSHYIADLAFEQIKRLDAALDAIDAKSGVLLGFTALLIAFTLSSGPADLSSPADLFFTYSGTGALLASVVLNILGIIPRGMRYDPNIKTLVNKYWDQELSKILATISANLAEVWETNGRILDLKSKHLRWALWLVLAGLSLLTIDVFVVRP